MKAQQIFKILLAIIVCQLAGVIGSIFTANKIQTWYNTLNQPSFTPPNWVFGPAWFTLYTLMGIVLYILWQKRTTNKEANKAVIIFLVHLFFNATWSIVFFGMQNISLALLNIVIILGFITYMMISFKKIDKKIVYLLAPYLLWVSYATALNTGIFFLN